MKVVSSECIILKHQDFKERDRILRDNVLKKWAARCSAECVKNWNDTVAPIIGVKAVK